MDSEDLEDVVMYAEPFQVPPATARAVNDAMSAGRRVIAVGTTVVRALESAWSDGEVRVASGFTRLYIHPGDSVHVVDGLLTGFHDPMASHLAMLYAIAGEEMVRDAYTEAVKSGYLWHEFGDSNLILPHAEDRRRGVTVYRVGDDQTLKHVGEVGNQSPPTRVLDYRGEVNGSFRLGSGRHRRRCHWSLGWWVHREYCSRNL